MGKTMKPADVVQPTTKTVSFPWIVPLIAIAITLFLFVQWKLSQGPLLTITFKNANGITTESPIIYRGIIVGRIETISLGNNAQEVIVQARLDSSATLLAKEHSKWWIVRPSVSLQ